MKAEPVLRGVLCGIGGFLAASGLVARFCPRPPPVVQALELVHAGVGNAFAALGAVYLIVHLVGVFGSAGAAVRGAPRAPLVVLALVGAFLACTGLALDGLTRLDLDRTFGAVATLLGLAGIAALFRLLVRGSLRNGFASGALLLLLAIGFVATGLSIGGGIQGHSAWRAHVLLAVPVTIVLLLHIASARRAGREPSGSRTFPWSRPLLRVALPVLTGLVGFAILETRSEVRSIGALEVDRAAVIPADRALARTIPAACSGCHRTVSSTWATSTHAFAAANPVFTALLEKAAAARGPDMARYCLRCHAPHAPDPATTSIAEIVRSDGYRAGVHCLSCHRGEPGPSRADGDLAFRPLGAEGFAFLTEYPRKDAADGTSWLARAAGVLVSSRVDLHRAAFGGSARPASCAPCHVQTLALITGGRLGDVLQDQYASWEQARGELEGRECAACHLPRFVAEEAYPSADHGFRAVSTYVARVAGGPRAESAAAAVLRGAPAVSPSAAQDEVAGSSQARPLLDLVVRLDSGEPRALSVETRSDGRIGHSFPNGPTDLIQVWLALRVTDASGHAIVDLGSSGPEGAPRLGHQLVDASGAPIEDHRLWDVDRLVGGGQIPPTGAHVMRIPLPAGEIAMPIRVEAEWRYRRLDPGLVKELTGSEAEGLPVVTIARFAGSIGEDPRKAQTVAGASRRSGRGARSHKRSLT